MERTTQPFLDIFCKNTNIAISIVITLFKVAEYYLVSRWNLWNWSQGPIIYLSVGGWALFSCSGRMEYFNGIKDIDYIGSYQSNYHTTTTTTTTTTAPLKRNLKRNFKPDYITTFSCLVVWLFVFLFCFCSFWSSL
jgi:hypothetical protein